MAVTAGEAVAIAGAAVGASLLTFLILHQTYPTIFGVQPATQQPKPVSGPKNPDGSGLGLSWFSENLSPRDPNGPTLI